MVQHPNWPCHEARIVGRFENGFALTLELRVEQERLEHIQEVIEEHYLSHEKQFAAESDKSWDAMHRAFSDGEMSWDGGDYPLNHTVLAGELLYTDSDYIMSLKTPKQVRDIAAALSGITEADFRRFAPDRPAWLTSLIVMLRWVGRRPDPFEQLGERSAAVRNEIEMWSIERDALMKRMATLSVEIHKKFSLPAACVVFVLVGAPIGMRVRRAGPAVAFVSVAFFLFYYMCLVGGEELANRLLLPPWLAMWLANIVIGVFGIRWTLEACELRASARRALPGTRLA